MKSFNCIKVCCSFLVLAGWGCENTTEVENITESVRLNQVGFYPENTKQAVVLMPVTQKEFTVVADVSGETVFTGQLEKISQTDVAGRECWKADFSELQKQGVYRIRLQGTGLSYPVVIHDHAYDSLLSAVLKGFYFQRASMNLSEDHAGQWARNAGHADDKVYVHASAASNARPEESVLSASRGWYDAGDYNKYMVNSGITAGTLLSLYEDFPTYFQQKTWGIPENGNVLPDILDEVLWNLEWMVKMQDPDDGGVYHKLTTADFEGMVAPAEGKAKRYVVAKSTAATLDFAAVMAQAARIYAKLPGYEDVAEEWQTQAMNAWDWAAENPGQLYDQNALNEQFDPDIQTGAYGDSNLTDEWIWAACELYLTTGDDGYLEKIPLEQSPEFSVPSWSNVAWLGYYSLLRLDNRMEHLQPFLEKIKSELRNTGKDWQARIGQTSFQAIMGKDTRDFVWGSNAVAANQGIAMIQLYLMDQDASFLEAAMANLDYLLGRNATGYCFVTGFGKKSPMHPHHRISEGDRVDAPVPGLLVGGPNPGQQDGCDYPSAVPDESYVDNVCSYAANEIAINWNAPMAYLVGAVAAIKE